MIKYTVPAMLEESFGKYSGQDAISYVGETPITYGEMRKKITQVASLLHSLGVKKGDKIAILSSNMPNWGVAFFSISWIGAVAVPILPDFSVAEIKTILDHSETKVLFVSENLYYKTSGTKFETVENQILTDHISLIPEGCQPKELKNLTPYDLDQLTPVNESSVEEEDLASIIYTSGTTGNSKGVMLTQKNISWNGKQAYTLQVVTKDDRFLSILPLSHTYENTLGLLLPTFHGASIFYLRKPPTTSVLIPALQKIKPTKILTVPLIIEKIFKTQVLPKFQKNTTMRALYSISPIRKVLHRVAGKKLMATFGGCIDFFGIGGAKLDETTERFLKEAKFPYAIGYGLTETAPLLAGTRPLKSRVGSTGLAMEGVQLRLADADPVTGEGEIQAKGPNVMRGYYKAEDITSEVFTTDGWFRTGDLGSFDKDNFLRIKGRIKTMIVGASGENIYPEEIESVINRMRFVLESLVVEKKGRLVALIHLNSEEIEQQLKTFKQDAEDFAERFTQRKNEILNEIQEKVNAQVNKFSKVQVVYQQLPFEKTPTHKIKRFLY